MTIPAREQAARDIAMVLNGVREPRDLPRGIVVKMRRESPDEGEIDVWLTHACKDHELEARCPVLTQVDEVTGATFVDIGPMVDILSAEIERCRKELVP